VGAAVTRGCSQYVHLRLTLSRCTGTVRGMTSRVAVWVEAILFAVLSSCGASQPVGPGPAPTSAQPAAAQSPACPVLTRPSIRLLATLKRHVHVDVFVTRLLMVLLGS